MAFTAVTLTGLYESAADTPAAGSLTFTLTGAMSNGGVSVTPSPIKVVLDATGAFSVVLFANDDAATVPQGVSYGVTEMILDAQPRDYAITLSHTTPSVDISTLAPGQAGWL